MSKNINFKLAYAKKSFSAVKEYTSKFAFMIEEEISNTIPVFKCTEEEDII